MRRRVLPRTDRSILVRTPAQRLDGTALFLYLQPLFTRALAGPCGAAPCWCSGGASNQIDEPLTSRFAITLLRPKHAAVNHDSAVRVKTLARQSSKPRFDVIRQRRAVEIES